MQKRKILETEKLCLREFELNDYGFIFKLVMSPMKCPIYQALTEKRSNNVVNLLIN